MKKIQAAAVAAYLDGDCQALIKSLQEVKVPQTQPDLLGN